MDWFRTIAAWIAIILAESVHGVLRRLFLVPSIGDLRSQQVGVLFGSGIILVISCILIRWLKIPNKRSQFFVGAIWVVLTVIFEFGVGALIGYSYDRMLSDYDLTQGGLMWFGLLFMLFAPMIAAKLRAVDQK